MNETRRPASCRTIQVGMLFSKREEDRGRCLSIAIRRRGILLLGLLVIVPLTGCLGLGYQIGTKTLFTQDVHTVYVPVFTSDEISSDITERLTEAVCKRIEARSPYKVVGRPTADSVLSGKIVRKTKNVSLYNNWNDPRQKIGVLVVEVTWKDRRDRDLRQFETISWNTGKATVTSTEYLHAEYGQSELTHEQRQVNEIADQIVGMMEMPW